MAQSLSKANKRDKARHKSKHGMRVSNKGIFTIVQAQVKRAEKENAKGE
jgi:hypothetical protein